MTVSDPVEGQPVAAPERSDPEALPAEAVTGSTGAPGRHRALLALLVSPIPIVGVQEAFCALLVARSRMARYIATTALVTAVSSQFITTWWLLTAVQSGS